MREDPRFFSALPDAICGTVLKKIGIRPFVHFAILILSVPMDPEAGKFREAADVADHVHAAWAGQTMVKPFVVCTGGEPLLQLDDALVDALHQWGFEVAVETNGTLLPPAGVDWICVSPKAGAPLVLEKRETNSSWFTPSKMPRLRRTNTSRLPIFFCSRWMVRCWTKITQATISYCLQHPKWRLSVQSHKLLGIP